MKINNRLLILNSIFAVIFIVTLIIIANNLDQILNLPNDSQIIISWFQKNLLLFSLPLILFICSCYWFFLRFKENSSDRLDSLKNYEELK